MASKKSTKPISEVRQAYNRERSRIQRQLRRMMARGYIVPGDILPPIPKRVTVASVRRLQKITTKKLYDSSDFQDLVSGEVVPGKEGRKLERKRSAQKAAQKRKRKTRDEFVIEQGRRQWELAHPEEDEEREAEEAWSRERVREDIEERARMAREDRRQQFNEGRMIAQRIEDTINSIESTFSPKLASYARNAWNNALANQSEADLYKRLADNPQIVDALSDAFYQSKSGDHFSPVSFNRFVSLLQGSALSLQDTRNIQGEYEDSQALYPDIDEGITD